MRETGARTENREGEEAFSGRDLLEIYSGTATLRRTVEGGLDNMISSATGEHTKVVSVEEQGDTGQSPDPDQLKRIID